MVEPPECLVQNEVSISMENRVSCPQYFLKLIQSSLVCAALGYVRCLASAIEKAMKVRITISISLGTW